MVEKTVKTHMGKPNKMCLTCSSCSRQSQTVWICARDRDPDLNCYSYVHGSMLMTFLHGFMFGCGFLFLLHLLFSGGLWLF